ncbi:anchored repeat-type ABC transporter ATP-binding subunit [Corynebacterium hindlerae]|uniref:Anchored repeat-type ABC transporter ATP-binding subunit n=1 Tax=Corynebacterium hindlerae TaxID=699041 RepID=A0A7G5FCZ3_9CORY|nr:anchored repeat-type ABC transporter ATP-binding subunit [Corynebacterium hindlerae]QMV84484.1 anchored repeat-type ABC transporter ATP-binding subunit [Corynebacterium hindlerae]QTH59605.1 anchored repeat-type ABC transporter ATP-binding subunit [Corynebacterium hindlerae]
MTPLVVSNLCVNLAGREVLRGVDLEIAPGEFVGLIGPNGAGKTTLFRSILGLLPMASGDILISGERVAKARDRIGYVPQRHEFAWDFPISIHDTVMTGRARSIGWLRRPRVDDYKAVDRALGRVRLQELADRPIGELSGGQRQRVLVARALASDPDILLLDEPFTGLDMPSAELLLELFNELAEEGVAIVMSTHNLPEAMEVCSRVVLLNGKVIASGSPDELQDQNVWMEAFGITAASPLLRIVGVA